MYFVSNAISNIIVRTYAVGGRMGVFGRATPAQTPVGRKLKITAF